MGNRDDPIYQLHFYAARGHKVCRAGVDKIERLEAALREAIIGIAWYRDTYPESDSGADDEFLERAMKALK